MLQACSIRRVATGGLPAASPAGTGHTRYHLHAGGLGPERLRASRASSGEPEIGRNLRLVRPVPTGPANPRTCISRHAGIRSYRLIGATRHSARPPSVLTGF